MALGTWFVNMFKYSYLYNVQNWNGKQNIWDKQISCKHDQPSCKLDATITLYLWYINLIYILDILIKL
jgi:hypothetical protein